MKMKIYTKGGDKGMTSLIGGKRVYKSDAQVDAYGTIDELIAHIGLIRSYNELVNIDKYEINNILLEIEDKLMVCASNVALEKGKDITLLNIVESDIIFLEKLIDIMTNQLPILNSFILPGGTIQSAECHIARTVCRRAERLVIGLSINDEEIDNEMVIKYLNRLSDFLFTLARLFNTNDILWNKKRGE